MSVSTATAAVVAQDAESFLGLCADGLGWDRERLARRRAAVLNELARTGTYRHTPAELVLGAKLAWRNHTRCIGKLYGKTLMVRECRRLHHPGAIGHAGLPRLLRSRDPVTEFLPVVPFSDDRRVIPGEHSPVVPPDPDSPARRAGPRLSEGVRQRPRRPRRRGARRRDHPHRHRDGPGGDDGAARRGGPAPRPGLLGGDRRHLDRVDLRLAHRVRPRRGPAEEPAEPGVERSGFLPSARARDRP
ncbi:nitric oxide synthase oxygenase [Nonomuraea sp. FMUSA5-5]|uniref:Nitric oxide synthase oxygenase n=1 Tax=Nonomuraea composti TaxID=2720023 RepID=A0ABX1B1C2_9ACTN|nr:nitric oxide synthase oxygenase [Nonomuraea sp. FMUSA5-5]